VRKFQKTAHFGEYNHVRKSENQTEQFCL